MILQFAMAQTQPNTTPPLENALPLLSVLIVTYKSRSYIGDCLRGLFEHAQGLNLEVLLTDCSNDGTCQWVNKEFPSVRIIDNHQNLGYARGNNFLAQQARGKYLLLLNPDTIIRDNAIQKLLDLAQQKTAGGAWGGVTELPDGRVDPGARQVGPGLLNSLFHALFLARFRLGGIKPGSQEPAQVPVLTGAFMMFDTALWRQLGGLDETLFMYSEEEEICERVRNMNREVWMTPQARIVHMVGGGSSKNPQRMLAIARSRMHVIRKSHGALYVLSTGFLIWLHAALRCVVSILAWPAIGKLKSAELRNAFAPIMLHPTRWSPGWTAQNRPGESET